MAYFVLSELLGSQRSVQALTSMQVEHVMVMYARHFLDCHLSTTQQLGHVRLLYQLTDRVVREEDGSRRRRTERLLLFAFAQKLGAIRRLVPQLEALDRLRSVENSAAELGARGQLTAAMDARRAYLRRQRQRQRQQSQQQEGEDMAAEGAHGAALPAEPSFREAQRRLAAEHTARVRALRVLASGAVAAPSRGASASVSGVSSSASALSSASGTEHGTVADALRELAAGAAKAAKAAGAAVAAAPGGAESLGDFGTVDGSAAEMRGLPVDLAAPGFGVTE
ncbi:unnamed protein product, partial [Phaeothamnion confervicola]